MNRGKRNGRWSQAGVLLGFAFLIAACGVASTPPSPTLPSTEGPPGATVSAGPLTDVSFILDYTPGAVHLGFYSAQANGYYKNHGLNVQIIPGRGSKVAVDQVAAGSAMIGFADFSAMAAGVAAGEPVEMVADILQRGSSGLAFLCDTNINSVQDLKGKRIAGPAGTTTFLLLAALLQKNGMTDNDYTQVIVDSSAQTQAVLGGQADARTTTLYDAGFAVAAQKVGKTGCTFGFGAHGLPTMGHGIIASSSMIATHPDIVRNFVAASMEGWAYALAHPDQALQQLLQLAPDAAATSPDVGWPAIPPLLHTDRTQNNPLGWMSPADVKDTLDILESSGILTQRLADDQYFTDDFVPGS